MRTTYLPEKYCYFGSRKQIHNFGTEAAGVSVIEHWDTVVGESGFCQSHDSGRRKG